LEYKSYWDFFSLLFASCCICITNNSMSFLLSTQHLFNSHYMFRPQRVIFRCYKHLVTRTIRVTVPIYSTKQVQMIQPVTCDKLDSRI
jgi:hypothetical protein